MRRGTPVSIVSGSTKHVASPRLASPAPSPEADPLPHAPKAYFTRTGPHTFAPSSHTSGAWSESEQHISPMGGLIVHELEAHAAARDGHSRPSGSLAISRLSMDILGVLPVEEFDVHVEVVRPGRTVELLEATVTSGDRPAVRARAWRLATGDTQEVAGGEGPALPAPQTLQPWPMTSLWPGGYIASLDVRPTTPPAPGRATAWVHTPLQLLAGEQSSDLARFIALVDTANGIAVRRSPQEWMFPNVDLTIHLHRQPAGDWVGLDTTVIFGAAGHGLTSTVLHDSLGPVGRAEQALTIRPL